MATRVAGEFLDRPGVLPASVVLAVQAGAVVAVLKHGVARRLEARSTRRSLSSVLSWRRLAVQCGDIDADLHARRV
ncbi:hypothetical protein [Micromonospora craterilacus]|uniref:hypothetical protein n=1 Tax=Micromonospora craterilacus TaxID=1655439 RepID=UPI001314BE04|nr:hypothetical protein [Micromonospora craterilacus]